MDDLIVFKETGEVIYLAENRLHRKFKVRNYGRPKQSFCIELIWNEISSVSMKQTKWNDTLSKIIGMYDSKPVESPI